MTRGRQAPSWVAASLLAFSALLAGCTEPPLSRFAIAGHRYDTAHVRHMALPKALREVSGLAAAGPGQVYAHNDEQGTIYLIDYQAARVVGTFALTAGNGSARVKDDFEGIARIGERLFLVTSRGVLYESRIGASGESVPMTRHRGTLDCEVEGLAVAASGRSLLAACKNLPHGGRDIVVYAWDLERQAYDTASPALWVAAASLTAYLTAHLPDGAVPKRVQPSGIAVMANGNVLLVAARQHLLLEFTAEGAPVAAVVLDPALHRQAEGLDVDAAGRLLIASEGDGKGDRKTPGVLSVYEPID